MEKEKAIEIFNKWMDCKDAYQADPSCDGNCFSCEYYASAEEEKEAMQMAISALKKQEQDKWIPVTERLPEEDKDVLVTVHFLGLKQTHPNGWNDHIKPSFYVDIAKHYSGEWCSTLDEYKVARSRHIVTAWRPLPEPYTEEGRSMSKKLYIVDGTFSALVEAESEEDAKASFDPIDIDDYRILSVEAEEYDD